MNDNPKHSKCVPLEIYQKVYNERKQLRLELENLNNKLHISNNKDKKNNTNILSLSHQTDIKNFFKEKENLENVIQNQIKNINIIKC